MTDKKPKTGRNISNTNTKKGLESRKHKNVKELMRKR